MIYIAVALGGLVLFASVIWLARWQGQAAIREKVEKEAADKAKAMLDAETTGPKTAEEVISRLGKGTF